MALQGIKRARDGYGSGWWALLLCIPPVAGVLMLVLALNGAADPLPIPHRRIGFRHSS